MNYKDIENNRNLLAKYIDLVFDLVCSKSQGQRSRVQAL